MRTRPLLIVALLSAALPTSNAQNPDGAIVLTPDWKVGDRFGIEITSERTEILGGQELEQGGTVSDVTIEVKERREDGYRLDWTWGATRFVPERIQLRAARSPGMQAMRDINEGVVFEIRTDHRGFPKTVLNLDDLLGYYQQQVAGLSERLGLPDGHPSLVTLELYTVPERLESFALRQPILFLLATGAVLVPGKPTEYGDSMTEPLSQRLLPAVAQFSLRSLDDRTGQAVVSWQQQPTPEAQAELELQVRGSTRPDVAPVAVVIRDEATLTIDRATGWPSLVVHTTMSRAGTRGQIQKTTFVRKAAK